MRVAEDGFPSVTFDPSGRLLAAGGATGPVRVWRAADQRAAYPPLAGHAGEVSGAAFDLERPGARHDHAPRRHEAGCRDRSATATSWP